MRATARTTRTRACPNSCFVVVEAEDGVTVLTHLWWDENRQPAVDPLAEDPKALDTHRLQVLELADWIIPGHGKRFRNPQKPL